MSTAAPAMETAITRSGLGHRVRSWYRSGQTLRSTTAPTEPGRWVAGSLARACAVRHRVAPTGATRVLAPSWFRPREGRVVSAHQHGVGLQGRQRETRRTPAGQLGRHGADATPPPLGWSASPAASARLSRARGDREPGRGTDGAKGGPGGAIHAVVHAIAARGSEVSSGSGVSERSSTPS